MSAYLMATAVTLSTTASKSSLDHPSQTCASRFTTSFRISSGDLTAAPWSASTDETGSV